MARIIEHLPAEALEARYRAARGAAEARHLQAIRLPAQGRTALDVAGALAFTPRWVEELAARCNASGPEALGDRRRRDGRTAGVPTEAALAALSERPRAPPEDGGAWTGPEAAPRMARHLGLERVHPRRGWEALKRVRWPVQAPRPRRPRAATAEQRAGSKGGSTRRPHEPGRRAPASRSRPGPRTSAASA
jgi:hypothetical protein